MEQQMPATVEELTIAREGDERMAPRRELKKQVITTGSWPTVAYLYEELQRKKAGDEWSGPRFSLVRYRKMKGALRFQKEFAVTKREHAQGIKDTLEEWLKDEVWTA